MIGDRLPGLAVCGLLLMSCAATDNAPAGSASTVPASTPTGPVATPTATAGTSMVTDTTVVDGEWAHEVELFFDALEVARPHDLSGFYVASAVVEDRNNELRLEGLDEIARMPRDVLGTGRDLGLMFVGADRAAVVGVSDRPAALPLTDLMFYEMSDGRIAFESTEEPVALLAKGGYLTKARAERVEALYTAYITAWDSRDRERIEPLYQPGATRTDGLFGGSWAIGEDWINTLPVHLRMDAESVTYQAAIDAHFEVAATLTTALFSAPTNDDPTTVRATFDLGAEHGCQLRLMAVWELDGYLIASEEILYDVDSLRSCAATYGLEPLPDGWWTGWELPPVVEEVTAQVATPAGTVDVTNAERRQVQLLEWALGRFERAGLATPVVDVVAFPPTDWCAQRTGDYFGLTVFNEDETRVDMCTQETEICIGPACDTMRTDARLSVLHELAHVWEHQYLDDTTRDAFLADRDLAVWWVPNPAGTPLDIQEGAEHAADIIAWGLMDEAVPMARIDATPEQLRAAFRLLTDAEPLLGP